jgi:hypothetical protein
MNWSIKIDASLDGDAESAVGEENADGHGSPIYFKRPGNN